MTNRQRLELRASEIRSRLNEIAGLQTADLTDEIRSESDTLQTEYRSVETQLRAAIVAEGAETPEGQQSGPESPEGAELRGLIQRASVAAIADAALEQRATEGAELELQQHFRLGPSSVPLELLRGETLPELERRDVTPAPSDTGVSQAAILPYLFPRSAGAFLGVSNPTVPVGERLYPVLTTPATVHAPAKDNAATETTGAFATTALNPKRLQAEFFFNREDLATFAGMEAALRQNLGDALADALDSKIIGQFFAASGGLTNPTNPTNEATFATYRSHLFGGIDGRYAYQAADLRWLVNADVYKHMAGEYRANSADDSALDSVMRASGGVRVSSHIPAKASNVSGFLVSKAGTRGQNAVAPVWQGVTLIRDEYTKADKGQVRLIAVMLYNIAILRTDGFQRLEVHTG